MSTINFNDENGRKIAEALQKTAGGRTKWLVFFGLLSLVLGGICFVIAGDSPGWLAAKWPWLAVQLKGFGLDDATITAGFKWASGLLVTAGMACMQAVFRKVVEKDPVHLGTTSLEESAQPSGQHPSQVQTGQDQDELIAIANAWKERAEFFEAEYGKASGLYNRCDTQRSQLYGQMVWRRLLLRAVWMIFFFALAYTVSTWVFRAYNPKTPLSGEGFGLVLTGAFGIAGILGGVWLWMGKTREAGRGHQIFVVGLAAFVAVVSFSLMCIGKGTAFHTEVFASDNAAVHEFITKNVSDPKAGYALYKDKGFDEMMKVLAFYFFGLPSTAVAGAGIGQAIARILTSKVR